jgi:hypothetical protein
VKYIIRRNPRAVNSDRAVRKMSLFGVTYVRIGDKKNATASEPEISEKNLEESSKYLDQLTSKLYM